MHSSIKNVYFCFFLLYSIVVLTNNSIYICLCLALLSLYAQECHKQWLSFDVTHLSLILFGKQFGMFHVLTFDIVLLACRICTFDLIYQKKKNKNKSKIIICNVIVTAFGIRTRIIILLANCHQDYNTYALVLS